MDKLAEMQVFVAAIRCGSFSAAGRELNLSPSAVSKLVTRLESRLGVRLLNRTTRTLSPTEAGQQFYHRCLEIIADVEDAEDALSDFGQIPKGKLRINTTQGFAKHQLLPVLTEFQQRYPQLELELQLTGQAVDLIAERVDLAIRLGVLEDTSLIARRLGESRRLVCASPTYLERHGIPRRPVDLRGHNCLRLSTSQAFNRWRFRTPAGDELIEADGSFVTDNIDALYDYALLGGGVARLSSFMAKQAIDDGRLAVLLEEYETDRQQVHLLYAHRKHLPGKIKVFVDFLLETFAQRPWE